MFVWFEGVVEDRNDPEKMGRVRVRCYGIHTDNKVLIATEDLPWATVGQPTSSAGVTGIGESHHGLVKGSTVYGFFRDGEDRQDPLIMGAISSKSMDPPNPRKGFNDPDGQYPKSSLLGEPDANRLARGLDTESKILVNKRNTTKGVKTSTGKTWDEVSTKYAAKYPFNKVTESESGHVKEVDDTEGAERLHEFHRTGTFREVHPDGTVVTRVVADNYEIVYGDEFVNVKGDVNLTIDSNCNLYIKQDWNIKVDGNVNVDVGKNWTESVGAARNVTIGSTDNRTSGGKMHDKASRIDHN